MNSPGRLHRAKAPRARRMLVREGDTGPARPGGVVEDGKACRGAFRENRVGAARRRADPEQSGGSGASELVDPPGLRRTNPRSSRPAPPPATALRARPAAPRDRFPGTSRTLAPPPGRLGPSGRNEGQGDVRTGRQGRAHGSGIPLGFPEFPSFSCHDFPPFPLVSPPFPAFPGAFPAFSRPLRCFRRGSNPLPAGSTPFAAARAKPLSRGYDRLFDAYGAYTGTRGSGPGRPRRGRANRPIPALNPARRRVTRALRSSSEP